jgi:hypothetical protein
MVYAIVIEFWALAGMLAGFVARRQDTEPLGSKGGGG